jgi:hypothetical protein
VSLKVIGAGFGRTGTLSLQAALEELGFTRCYHMKEVLVAHPEHAAVWRAARRGEPVDWDALFAGYQAAVDWPASAFYHELMERYPDAKVILTVRDGDKWHKSALQTIYYFRQAFPAWTHWLIPRMRRVTQMIDDVIWVGIFQGRFADKQHAIAVFHRHIDEVRRTVPADRLLVYEVSQGWGPLCAFLGKDAPKDKPFPRLNDTTEFRSRIRKIAAVVWGVSCAAVVLIVLCLIWLVATFMRT